MGTAVRCWVRPLGRGDDTEVLKVRRGLTGGGGRLGGGDNDEIEDEEPCAPSTFILFAGYEKDTYLMYHNTRVECELHNLLVMVASWHHSKVSPAPVGCPVYAETSGWW